MEEGENIRGFQIMTLRPLQPQLWLDIVLLESGLPIGIIPGSPIVSGTK